MKEYLDQPKSEDRDVEAVLKKIPKDKSDKYFESNPGKERQGLKDDDAPDSADEIFKEINPLGLLVGDLKKKIEGEIEDLESLIDEMGKLGPELNKEVISGYKKELVAKNL